MKLIKYIKSLFLGTTEDSIDYLNVGEMPKVSQLLDEGKVVEAFSILKEEIRQRPENGYAHYRIGVIYLQDEQYGQAITAFNTAIRYLNKDKVWQTAAFYNRAVAYSEIKDYGKMLEDIDRCIKLNPEEIDAWLLRAEYYYNQTQYELAKKDLERVLEIEPGTPDYYINMSHCEEEMGNVDEARRLLEYAISLDEKCGDSYFVLGKLLWKNKEYEDAIDRMIKGLDLSNGDPSEKQRYLLFAFPDECSEMITSKLKAMCASKSNNGYWPHLLGHFYHYKSEYLKAVECYEESFKRNGYPIELLNKANSLYLAHYDYKALYTLNKAMNMDPSSYDYIDLRIRILLDLERFDECEEMCVEAIKLFPEDHEIYANYADCLRYKGNLEGALNMANKVIELDPNDLLGQYTRGKIYDSMGLRDLAALDFKVLVDQYKDCADENFNVYECIAYKCLNRLNDAFDVLAKPHEENYEYYIAKAWCLADARRTEEALESVQQACNLGFRCFYQLTNPYTPDSLRTIEGFDEVITKAKEKYLAMQGDEYLNKTEESSVVEVVPFTKEFGEICVKGEVNGLPLRFVLDTGASVISISTIEAAFMLKNGYLEERDLGGVVNYRLANADLIEGTVVNLREVKLGNVVFHDVRASIQKNQDAPLLMGRSMFGRMQTFSVDNDKKTVSFVMSQE